MNTSSIVQKLWNYCNVLRDDGMSYGDYVEQLTYLLFLKMADELACAQRASRRTKAPYLLARGLSACDAQAGAQASNQKSLPAQSAQVNPVPEKYSWPNLAPTLALPRKRGRGLFCGDELFDHYRCLQ